MLNFIQVSFCFLLFLQLGLGNRNGTQAYNRKVKHIWMVPTSSLSNGNVCNVIFLCNYGCGLSGRQLRNGHPSVLCARCDRLGLGSVIGLGFRV